MTPLRHVGVERKIKKSALKMLDNRNWKKTD